MIETELHRIGSCVGRELVDEALQREDVHVRAEGAQRRPARVPLVGREAVQHHDPHAHLPTRGTTRIRKPPPLAMTTSWTSIGFRSRWVTSSFPSGRPSATSTMSKVPLPRKSNGTVTLRGSPSPLSPATHHVRSTRRATIARKKVQVFKSHLDDRYGGMWRVSSHSGVEFEAVPVNSGAEIMRLTRPDTELVAIDEAQFLNGDIVGVVTELAGRGLRVILAGTDTDFRGEPFGPMGHLMVCSRIQDRRGVINGRINKAVIGLRLASGGDQTGIRLGWGFRFLGHTIGASLREWTGRLTARVPAAKTYTSAPCRTVNPLTRQADRSVMPR